MRLYRNIITNHFDKFQNYFAASDSHLGLLACFYTFCYFKLFVILLLFFYHFFFNSKANTSDCIQFSCFRVYFLFQYSIAIHSFSEIPVLSELKSAPGSRINKSRKGSVAPLSLRLIIVNVMKFFFPDFTLISPCLSKTSL